MNINCGVLGHIDAGKTALCKALHDVASTASMDKDPQSRERGITLDMGFSCFSIPSSRKLVTLVDCPGHAGLIRTVLGASQIIDVCLLVIDAQKGVQAQTAECLVIAEIVTSNLIVVINKLDLISESSRPCFIEQMSTNIRKAFSKTKYGDGIPISFVSAVTSEGLDSLVDTISHIEPVRNDRNGVFHLSFDHCFTVKGQGTVLTGTILSGSVRKGQRIIYHESNETSEVRSIQVFHKFTESATQGDRIGICLPGLTTKDKERGDIFDAQADLRYADYIVIHARKVKYFKDTLDIHSFHLTVGHQTAMARPLYFQPAISCSGSIDTAQINNSSGNGCTLGRGPSWIALDRDRNYFESALTDSASLFSAISDIDEYCSKEQSFLCLLLLDRRIRIANGALVVASRLDFDADHPGCRVALFGTGIQTEIAHLRKNILKTKIKTGTVDRVCDEFSCIVRGLLKKEGGDASLRIGKPVRHVQTNMPGVIESTFGKSGLLRIRFEQSVSSVSVGDAISLELTEPAFLKIIDGSIGATK